MKIIAAAWLLLMGCKTIQAKPMTLSERFIKGCTERTDFVAFGPEFESGDYTKVNLTSQPPAPDDTEVGSISVTAKKEDEKFDELALCMKIIAAFYGADAVVDFRQEETVSELRGPRFSLSVGTDNSRGSGRKRIVYLKRLRGIAVKRRAP